MSDDFRTLAGLLDALWARLKPGRTIAFATARPEGGAAVRNVILREADRAAAVLTLYTHQASEKITQLAHDPKAEILLWDEAAQLQSRLTGKAKIAPGPPDIWSALGDGSRQNYARDPLPRAPLDASDAALPTPDPQLFTMLTVSVDQIDILHLDQRPHVRARFSRTDDYTGQWVAP